ncbi:hypothetical protein HDV00_006681, partial [Rhizophlyctis rosea]
LTNVVKSPPRRKRGRDLLGQLKICSHTAKTNSTAHSKIPIQITRSEPSTCSDSTQR